MKPDNRALYNPTRFAQSAAMRRANSGEKGPDTAFAQALTVWLGTVAPVTLDDMWFAQGTARLAANMRNRGDQRITLGDVVAVRIGRDDRGSNALSVDDEVVFAAELASVGFGPAFFPHATMPAMHGVVRHRLASCASAIARRPGRQQRFDE